MLDNDIIEDKFKLQSHYYVYFQTYILGKCMNSLISLAMDLIVLLLFFNKDGFVIR